MTKLRKLAQGQQCMVRLPGVCNGNTDTTVLAHYRANSMGAGVGIKPHDLLGAWACSACHDAIDGRSPKHNRMIVRDAHRDGVLRTIHALIEKGVINC